VQTNVVAFATALAVSFCLTPLVRRLALQLGILDRPNPRKLHRTAMPLLGGLAIYAGAVLAAALCCESAARAQVSAILAGATLLVVVGILDERGWLHHQVKLFVGMPLAAVFLLAAGIRAEVASAFWPGVVGRWVDTGLTVLWIVGITAAFSILDHMDGLCAGIAAVASAFFLLLASIHGQVLVGTLAAAILGASLGFLRWNFKPAKIFMGDGGAMFLGFMLATVALKLRFPELPPETSWMVPVLLLGVPIFDTTLVSISRARRGLIPFASPGKDHTAHRLAGLGLGHRGAVLALYAAGAVLGLLALPVAVMEVRRSYTIATAVAVAAAVVVAALEKAPYERQEKAAR
jgi:UDP-GlcNAc:undecaprenyl-phosphate GlcNAc-1-phosphate transferase